MADLKIARVGKSRACEREQRNKRGCREGHSLGSYTYHSTSYLNLKGATRSPTSKPSQTTTQFSPQIGPMFNIFFLLLLIQSFLNSPPHFRSFLVVMSIRKSRREQQLNSTRQVCLARGAKSPINGQSRLPT